MAQLLRSPIRSLSSGQARRVALADAILLRPRVLLLDDFLSGLDQGMRQSMGTILSDAASFSSVIVTGHELADFASWSTRFMVLRNGIISAAVETAGLNRETLLDRLADIMKGEP